MLKRMSRVILAGIVCLQLAVGSESMLYMAEARESGSQIAVRQLPGTTVVEKAYDESFLAPTGYVGEGVGDRSGYYEEYLEYNRQEKEKFIAGGGKARLGASWMVFVEIPVYTETIYDSI